MKFTVAVDAMGGDESPLKVIKGLDLFLQNNQNLKFLIFGNRDLINPIYKSYLRKISFSWNLKHCCSYK